MTRKLTIGLLGIGNEAYWSQFEGLQDRLKSYINKVAGRLSVYNIELIDVGLIDNPHKAMEVGSQFRRADVDIILLYITTYALSSTVLPVVQRAKVPVLVLNLSPEAAINYEYFNSIPTKEQMTGEWLAHCSSCSVPEIANVFKRAGIQFYLITGTLENDAHCWNEIYEWVEAAKVAKEMFYNTLGAMGHYYSGMLDVYADLTAQLATFGGNIEMIEVDELSALRKQVSQDEIKQRVKYFYEIFDVQPECLREDLDCAAITSVALDKLADAYQFGSLAYYYKGSGNIDNEVTMSSIILGNSLLTARNIPVAGEYEIKNAQAMKILDCFGVGGSFTEFYALDFINEIILMGHDGPGHLAIARGRIKVSPLVVYHGKVGRGLSVEMAIKEGPVTCLSVVEDENNKLFLLVAQGESVAGPILQIGNTNSRYAFKIGVRAFINEWNAHGPAHHCAMGIGHIGSKIKKLGSLLNIKVVQVC